MDIRRGPLAAGLLLLLYGFFWIGLLYAVLINFVHLGASATTGWYMYALVVPEALLVYYGLAALFTERWSRRLLPLLTALPKSNPTLSPPFRHLRPRRRNPP